MEIAVFSSMALASIAKHIVENPIPKEPLIKAEVISANSTKTNKGSDTNLSEAVTRSCI